MTLHDARRLFNHWEKHPPLRVLVRGVADFLGVKFDLSEKPKYMTTEEALRMQELTGGRIPGVERM